MYYLHNLSVEDRNVWSEKYKRIAGAVRVVESFLAVEDGELTSILPVQVFDVGHMDFYYHQELAGHKDVLGIFQFKCFSSHLI